MHLLKENQMVQQEQIKEQCVLFNVTGVETAENRKLLQKIDRELLQLNASVITFPREMIMLTYDKNNLTMSQLRGKIADLLGGLSQIQFDI